MIMLFDLYSTQPHCPGILFNGGAEYVKKIFREVLIKKRSELVIYAIYDSKLYFEDELFKLCQAHNIKLLDISKRRVDQYIYDYKIDKLFIGIAQRYSSNLLLPDKIPDYVKIILVWIDVRDLEFDFTYKYSYLLNDINYKGRLINYLLNKYHSFIDCFYKKIKKSGCYENILCLAERHNTIIITTSQYTKYSILAFFPSIDKNKITVLWAPQLITSENMQTLEELKDVKYWFALGVDRWEKNIIPIINILDKIDSFKTNNKLVLTGSLKCNRLNNFLKDKKWIIVYENLDRSKLEWLYKHSSVFVYPAFVEGFGYPPTEAMKYAVPVIASATSSINEICADAPLYICPYSEYDIESKIRFMLDADLSEFSKKSLMRYSYIYKKQTDDLNELINIIFH